MIDYTDVVKVGIGRRLRTVLSRLGIGQKELSQLTGVSEGAISFVVRGKRNISFELLFMLHVVLRVNWQWLVFERGDMFDDGSIGGNPLTLKDLTVEERDTYGRRRAQECLGLTSTT